MKNFILFLSTFALLSSAQEALAETRTFVLKPTYAFTPKGFDTNDNAQVVLAGAFSDYCMQMGTTRPRVDKLNKKIYIDQTYTTTNNCYDIEMYIPYSVDVSLGALPAGNYEVYLLDTDKKYTLMSNLPISPAKTTNNGQTDDSLYAQVSSIEFKFNQGVNPILVINGVFTNSCLSLASVEVHARMGDVFEVLPIAVNRKSNCAAVMTPYSKTVKLTGFTQRDSLIHVRSMNGQAINKVITTLDRLK